MAGIGAGGLAVWRSWVKVLVGGDSVLDDSLYLLCTERCVDGRYYQGGSVVNRWGIRGESFLGGCQEGRAR
jgi:hypothetical protein